MTERKKGPGEAEGDGQAAHGYRNEVSWDDGQAKHGYRNEVSWDDGQGRQPYSNRGDAEQSPDAMPEPEAGNAGDTAGRNVEDLDAAKEKPDRTVRESPRST